MPLPFDAIAFDVDGTLLDSVELSVQVIYQTLKSAGCDLQREDLAFARHATDMEVWQRFGLGHRERELAQRMEEIRAPLLHQQPPFPGAIDMLKALRAQGVTLGLVSNRTNPQFDDPAVRELIALTDCWVSCETVGVGKPDPAPLLHFLARANCPPERALMVGDSLPDAQAARGAGLAFALALWGAHDPNIPADYRLERPEDLLQLITEHRI